MRGHGAGCHGWKERILNVHAAQGSVQVLDIAAHRLEVRIPDRCHAGHDRPRPVMACVAPIRYSNLEPVRRDIQNLHRALGSVHVEDAFLPAVAPGTVATHANQYYASEEEYLFAVG